MREYYAARTERRKRLLGLVIAMPFALGWAAATMVSGTPGISVDGETIVQAHRRPLPIRIWAPEQGTGLPLIVISHGIGGGLAAHEDTALALAKAGFVVAAVDHNAVDNGTPDDVERGQHLVARALQVSRLIDYMLKTWPLHDRIDRERIGMFGHSAGGFTALVVAGAKPDISRIAEYCRHHPEAGHCAYFRSNNFDPTNRGPVPRNVWHKDARVRAEVIVAPAIGYSFGPNPLPVRIPVQLWAAPKDPVVNDSPAVIGRLLPGAPAVRMVSGAGHLSFLAPCDWRLRTVTAILSLDGRLDFCADSAGFDRAKFHDDFNRQIVAFFERTLPKHRA